MHKIRDQTTCSILLWLEGNVPIVNCPFHCNYVWHFGAQADEFSQRAPQRILFLLGGIFDLADSIGDYGDRRPSSGNS